MNAVMVEEREKRARAGAPGAPGPVSLSFLGGHLVAISAAHYLIHVNKSRAPITAGLPEHRLSELLSDFLGELCLQVAKIYPVESQACRHTLLRGLVNHPTSAVSSTDTEPHINAPWSCLIMPHRLQKTRNFPVISATVDLSLPSGISTRWSSSGYTPRNFAASICSARFALFAVQAEACSPSSPNWNPS